ncbi:hypothetical protein PLICRDRAFT_252822 [Plicaturopsis crispa FD-325 SS-3]|nr:hypothetical protein PLICRDRAFT_252822 [Plicaturopsis crispa FD-325 SS-3]
MSHLCCYQLPNAHNPASAAQACGTGLQNKRTQDASQAHQGRRPTYEGSQRERKYGVTTEWVQNAKDIWETTFDWRAHEAHINSFPQYTTPIVDNDGKEYTIHFVGVFSEKVDAVPLVLLHGWPGSFLEFLPVLSLLTSAYTPATFPYHVIVPSLPGYTLSSAPPLDKDFTMKDVARLIDRLMVGLGFGAGYVAQGGDIGSKIATTLATNHASCKAVHINLCIMFQKPDGVDLSSMSDAEKRGIAQSTAFIATGLPYALEQATRPSTVGVALASSPVALLAWIGEKFLDWSDEDPSLDTILEALTLYWVTDTIANCLYPYRELVNHPSDVSEPYISTPLSYSLYPKEMSPIPRTWVAAVGNLVFYREHDKGGHFAALERPVQFVRDIEDFVSHNIAAKRSIPHAHAACIFCFCFV